MKFAKQVVFILSMLVGIGKPVFAQQGVVSAKLDTNQLLIGEQTYIVLKASLAKGIKVVFPVSKDSIISHVEVLESSKIDTSFSPDNLQTTYQQRIKITSFDSGFYAIPPFNFKIGNDSTLLQTEALLLGVQTVPVDTTLAFKPIKEPVSPPFSLMEYKNELIIGGVALLAIIALIYYLKTRKKQVVEVAPIVYKIPPHETALTALQELHDQKLWQQGQIKSYHSALSDIIRNYIEGRFSVYAMEMTSDEIMKSLRMHLTEPQLKIKLSQLLVLSDMVKFAKENPLPIENETSWNNAMDFVKHTALVNQEKEVSA